FVAASAQEPTVKPQRIILPNQRKQRTLNLWDDALKDLDSHEIRRTTRIEPAASDQESSPKTKTTTEDDFWQSIGVDLRPTIPASHNEPLIEPPTDLREQLATSDTGQRVAHAETTASNAAGGNTSCSSPACGPNMECYTAYCADGCCSGLCGCDPCRPRFWFRGETILWFMEGYDTPPLLTSSPAGTDQDSAGVLGLPTTTTLFGNDPIGGDLRIGGRLTAGWWFDDCRRLGIQGELMAIGNDDSGASFPTSDDQILARPFFNTDPAVSGPDAQVLNLDGLASGSIDFGTSSRVYSAAPSLRKNLICCSGTDACCQPTSWRVDGILGYRYFGINEAFRSREILEPQGASWPAGTRYELNDSVQTENSFHGVEVGAIWMYQNDRWLWEVGSRLAFGEVQRTLRRDGSTRITVPGSLDETRAGGFLVRPEDIGTFTESDYALLPQIRLGLGYCIGQNWRATVGYNFMHLNSIFRPGANMTSVFDGSTLGHDPTIGVVSDATRITQSVWLHGISFGLSYNF
ncbi:MAG: BBP7 family outer membrane beta-barrel protein, partial [Planctomycetota bacterium]